jgi:hypothetical protein
MLIGAAVWLVVIAVRYFVNAVKLKEIERQKQKI